MERIITTEQDRDDFIRDIHDMGLEKPIKFVFQFYKAKRSLSANALCHVWYSEISKEISTITIKTSPEQIKEMMKHSFLGYETKTVQNIVNGKISDHESLRKTSNLDKGDFCFYMQQIYYWAADLGIVLSTPMESEYMKWIREQNNMLPMLTDTNGI